MNLNSMMVNEPEQVPESDLQALLQQLLQSLSGSKDSSSTEPVPPDAALLADVRQALGKLQDQLQSKPQEEEGKILPVAVVPPVDPLAAVFESMPLPVAILDAQGRFQRANPSLATAFGFDPTGMSLTDVIGKVSLSQIDGNLANLEVISANRALRGETVPAERFRFTRLSGETVDTLLSASPLFSDQEVTGAVLLWQPVKETMTGKDESSNWKVPSTKDPFLDNQKTLLAILEHLPIGLAIAEGQEGRVRLISEYGKSSLPPEMRSIEDATWKELLSGIKAYQPNGETPTVIDELPPKRILEFGEKVEEEEWVFQGVDGEKRHFVFSGGPLRDEGGEISGGVLTWQDVTERKRSDALISESEARERARAEELEAVLDAVPATVWIAKDPECRVVSGNRYSYEMLRMSPGSNQSKSAPEGQEPTHFRVFHDGVELKPEELPLQVSAGKGIEIREFEEDIVFDDGHVSHVLGNVTPLFDEENRPRGAVAAFVDITRRVEAERALRESESRYRTLFASMAEGFSLQEILYDEDGKPVDLRWVELNPAFERITGVPRAKMVGKTRKEFKPTASTELVELMGREVQTGEPIHFEYFSDTLGKHLDISAYKTGENQFAVLTIDITERKKAEKALQRAQGELEDRVKERTRQLEEANLLLSERNKQLQSEISERLRAEAELQASKASFERLFESAPDPILLLDEKDCILNLNFQAAAKFGYDLEELKGETFDTLLPEYLRVHFDSWREGLPDESGPRPVILDLDLYAQRKDGGHFPVDITFSPIDLKEKNQNICIVHDITLRKQVEDALKQSEARSRAIFEQSPVGIHLLKLNGSNLEWNPRFQEMVGYDAEELAEMTYLDYTYPDDIELTREKFEALIHGEIEHYVLEKRILRKDGQVRWGKLSATLARDDQELPLFIVKIVEDIEEQKRVEAELEEVQRRLIDSAESERILIARELHDGPMQEIFGLTYNLASIGDSLQDAEQLAELRSVQFKMIEINQVLREIMRELRPPALTPFGLEKAILDHAERFDQKYPELTIRLDLMPDGVSLPERVRLALFRIYQAAVSNVARHAHASEVEIRLRLTEEEVVLEVRDNGVGFQFPERWIGLVRQGQYGLVGAAERAEAIGGRLEVSSQPGEGTLVRVNVPRGIDL